MVVQQMVDTKYACKESFLFGVNTKIKCDLI